jgi:GDP-D-mannose dehydratase
MKKPNAIIVGGSGQFGITLSKILLKNKIKVTITTRSLSRAKKKLNNKKLYLKKLDILNKTQIKNFLLKYKPKIIFYLAGQSSPGKSFHCKKETYLSNFIGCRNFLETLTKFKIPSKFVNFSSCEIYGNLKKKINLESKKKPISPYGLAKLKAHNETIKYRKKFNLKAYNAIIFNT